jgi:hypothetical protein
VDEPAAEPADPFAPKAAEPAGEEPADKPAAEPADPFAPPKPANEEPADPFGAAAAVDHVEGIFRDLNLICQSVESILETETAGSAEEAPQAEQPSKEQEVAQEQDDESLQPLAVDARPEPTVLPVRLWTDNTGAFQVRGRLAVIMADHIRIFKVNGRYTTVPMERLSPFDRDYVEQTLAEHGGGQFDLIAAK